MSCLFSVGKSLQLEMSAASATGLRDVSAALSSKKRMMAKKKKNRPPPYDYWTGSHLQ